MYKRIFNESNNITMDKIVKMIKQLPIDVYNNYVRYWDKPETFLLIHNAIKKLGFVSNSKDYVADKKYRYLNTNIYLYLTTDEDRTKIILTLD